MENQQPQPVPVVAHHNDAHQQPYYAQPQPQVDHYQNPPPAHPQFNPNYHPNPQAQAPLLEPNAPPYNPFADDDDDETVIGDGTPCYEHFVTIFGVWAAFGILYWSIFTLMGYFTRTDDSKLYLWNICSYISALIGIVIIMVGISKGIEVGTKRAAHYVGFYCFVVNCNIWIHVFFGRKNDNFLSYSVAFLVCDFISMIYISGASYGFHKRTNKCFRLTNFLFEWFDLLSQIVVLILYAQLSKASNSGTFQTLFWVFILIQLFVWIFPILYGSGLKTKTLIRQLFLLDLVTDLPLLIVNIASQAFMLNIWILIDLLVKVAFMLRYVWIIFKNYKDAKLNFKKHPFQIIQICPFLCDVDHINDKADLEEPLN